MFIKFQNNPVVNLDQICAFYKTRTANEDNLIRFQTNDNADIDWAIPSEAEANAIFEKILDLLQRYQSLADFKL